MLNSTGILRVKLCVTGAHGVNTRNVRNARKGNSLNYGFSDRGAYWFGDMTVPYPDIHCSIELGMNFRSRWASGVRKSEV